MQPKVPLRPAHDPAPQDPASRPHTHTQAQTHTHTHTQTQTQTHHAVRQGYPPQLVSHILSHHKKTGGNFKCVLDVGCGAGNLTRDVAVHFDRAIGVDASAGMVAAARKQGGRTNSGRAIEYVVGAAEACEGVAAGSVDLIVAGMAVHWFEMEAFWRRAARVLKTSGTVALCSVYRMYCHPTTPERDEVQRLLFELERETLKPYTLPGNVHVMTNYERLPMPWMFAGLETPFDKYATQRTVWNADGEPDALGGFFAGEALKSLDEWEQAMSTSSAVTRWQKAHPHLSSVPNACVASTFAQIRKVMGEGVNEISMVGPTVAITMKRIWWYTTKLY